jgi:mannose-P-dolichol utilization defect protein 1
MLSKLLGYLIILGSAIVKVPQIMKILRENSVEGLSLEMFVLEIIGYLIVLFVSLYLLGSYTICTTYGYFRQFPFSTYGEVLLIGIQSIGAFLSLSVLLTIQIW